MTSSTLPYSLRMTCSGRQQLLDINAFLSSSSFASIEIELANTWKAYGINWIARSNRIFCYRVLQS